MKSAESKMNEYSTGDFQDSQDLGKVNSGNVEDEMPDLVNIEPENTEENVHETNKEENESDDDEDGEDLFEAMMIKVPELTIEPSVQQNIREM